MSLWTDVQFLLEKHRDGRAPDFRVKPQVPTALFGSRILHSRSRPTDGSPSRLPQPHSYATGRSRRLPIVLVS